MSYRISLILFLFSVTVLAQADMIVSAQSKDTLVGTFLNESFNGDQSEFRFVAKGKPDTLSFTAEEISSIKTVSVTYKSVVVPPQYTSCHRVFAKQIIRDCMSLYEYYLDGKKVYLLQKADNLFTPIERGNISRVAPKYFREQLSASRKFSSGKYNFDSVPLAVTKYNEWMIEKGHPCAYHRAFGFVGWWERAAAAIEIGGNTAYHSNGAFESLFNMAYGYESAFQCDALHHLIGFSVGFSQVFSSNRNNLGTLNRMQLNDFSARLQFKKLMFDNPFQYYYLSSGFSLISGSMKVQRIACDVDPYNVLQINGNAFHFGLGRVKNNSYVEISYVHQLLNGSLQSQVYLESQQAGFATMYPTGAFVSGMLKLSVGCRISLVPLIRQYKQL